MADVCPTILAATPEDYKTEMDKVAGFAHRIQIDLADGEFVNPKTLRAKDVWWPVGIRADIHLMYTHPMTALRELVDHQPHMVISHAESLGDFNELKRYCRGHGIKVGIALLPQTPPEHILTALGDIDHVLIFGGNLGHQGGHADLSQLSKVAVLKQHKPRLEIGWDGGINDQNISQLAFGGIDVFNVGAYIQKAPNPEKAFRALERIAEETGTT